MEPVIAAHTFFKANKEMVATVVKMDFDTTDYNPQPTSKSVPTPPSNMRSAIEQALADLAALTKTNVNAIVENCLTNWTSTLEWKFVKAVDSIFEDALEASYFNWNNGWKYAMFDVFEQGLSKMVRSGRVDTGVETKTCILVQTKAVADTIVKSELSNTGCTVPITETAGKMVARVLHEYRVPDMKEASTTVAHDEPWIARPPLCATRP